MHEFDYLKTILPGLKEDMPRPFYMIAELIDYGSFEVCKTGKNNGQYIIPYIMNDAVECYIEVCNALLKGSYESSLCVTSASLIEKENGYGLIIRQGNENAFTLWFSDLLVHENLYRYHEIGHFWVKGQEQWRQLVYMTGTIADKYLYMGEEYCNEKEKFIQSLIYFSPFRRLTPVPDDLMEYHFPLKTEGISIMEELCEEAGDEEYAALVRDFAKNPTEKEEIRLSRKLMSARRQGLYQYIYDIVCEASEPYPQRDYGKELNGRIEKRRKKLEHDLKKHGFEGSYPHFKRKNVSIIVTEEQPFIMDELEWDDFKFAQNLMVSKTFAGKNNIDNAGFFHGIGNKGRVIKYDG